MHRGDGLVSYCQIDFSGMTGHLRGWGCREEMEETSPTLRAVGTHRACTGQCWVGQGFLCKSNPERMQMASQAEGPGV